MNKFGSHTEKYNDIKSQNIPSLIQIKSNYIKVIITSNIITI